MFPGICGVDIESAAITLAKGKLDGISKTIGLSRAIMKNILMDEEGI